MPRIDCGPGKVFNPNSGKCIQREGATAKKLANFGTQLSQSGECNGTVKRGLKSGVPYCTPSTVYVHANTRGPSTRANAAKRNIERQKREIDELKRLRSRNAEELKRISLKVKRIEERIDLPQGTKRTRIARERNDQPDRPTKRAMRSVQPIQPTPQGTKRTRDARDVRERNDQPARPNTRPTKRASTENRPMQQIQPTRPTRPTRPAPPAPSARRPRSRVSG